MQVSRIVWYADGSQLDRGDVPRVKNITNNYCPLAIATRTKVNLMYVEGVYVS